MKDIETVKIEMKKENPLPIVEEQKKEETKRSTRVKKPNPKFG